MDISKSKKEYLILSLLIEAWIIDPKKENIEEIVIFMISQDISLTYLEELCLKEADGEKLYCRIKDIYQNIKQGIKE